MNIAAILSAIWAWLTSGTGFWGVSGVAVLVISYMLKKYINDKAWEVIGDVVENALFVVGSIVTIFMNKITKGIWNKIIEPVFQIFIDTILTRAAIGIKRGLDSDDELAPEEPE